MRKYFLVVFCLLLVGASSKVMGDSLTLYGDTTVVTTADPLHPLAWQSVSNLNPLTSYGGGLCNYHGITYACHAQPT